LGKAFLGPRARSLGQRAVLCLLRDGYLRLDATTHREKPSERQFLCVFVCLYFAADCPNTCAYLMLILLLFALLGAQVCEVGEAVHLSVPPELLARLSGEGGSPP